jgi:BirA family transcriptional regulator, biotin operon repressor / biotin---[acetyl-CoA-carboxylase] ligase
VAFGAVGGDLLLGDSASGDAAFGCADFFAGRGAGGARGGREIAPQLAVDLKWPNDLLLGGKKFCGILTEMNAEATRVRYLVVGMGINVNQVKFPAELREIATSLRIETGTEWSRVELCAALLKALDREYRSLVEDAGAREAILRRFEEGLFVGARQKVTIEENGGLAGVTEGLDERGFLRVRAADGLRTRG